MYKQIAANKRNTVLIMFFFVLVIAAVGWAVAFLAKYLLVSIWVLVFCFNLTVVEYF